jgi:hypothetical protein
MPRKSLSATFGRDAAAGIASHLQKRTRPKAVIRWSVVAAERLPQTGRPREMQQDWRGNVNAADEADVPKGRRTYSDTSLFLARQ